MSQGRRTQPLPPDWEQLRAQVLELHAGRCHRCGGPGATQVDHIIPAAEGGTDDLANLAPIHASCHNLKTALEAARARARKYQLHRDPERHPGMRRHR